MTKTIDYFVEEFKNGVWTHESISHGYGRFSAYTSDISIAFACKLANSKVRVVKRVIEVSTEVISQSPGDPE